MKSQPMTKPFELKPVPFMARRVGDKLLVRVVCTDAKRKYPVIGLVQCPDGEELHESYTIEGKVTHGPTNYTLNDLENLPERIEGWFNIYRYYENGAIVPGGCLYPTKQAAEIDRAPHCIATVKISFEEGEGL